eukprot:scaffold4907_cov99-Skeletonema_marinoi.AAC.3
MVMAGKVGKRGKEQREREKTRAQEGGQTGKNTAAATRRKHGHFLYGRHVLHHEEDHTAP